jgi:predicted Ser/Thr protein kinase
VHKARARLRRAGFAGIRFYRTGPQPGETELWLPIGAPEIADRIFAERPPHSRREAIERRAWRVLAPVCAIARLPGEHEGAADEIPDPDAWVLLTGGAESDAKVVGLPFSAAPAGPDVVAKFARVAKADAALEREASILRDLERERPGLTGVPRLRAGGRRVGQVAIVQDAINGKALSATMNAAEFAAVAPAVTRWLLALAGEPAPQPASSWAQRLVRDPLDEIERDFAELAPADFAERARRALSNLGDLPLVCEHRDFGPWNIVIARDGTPAVIDWEDAEPEGLPSLDLVYFLFSAAFAIDGAGDAADRVERARESNRRLLDPSTKLGGITAACVEDYRTALRIGEDDFRRLRLLCWIVQTLIAYRRLSQKGAGPVAAAADGDLFLGLAEDELQAIEGRS